ncbi:histone-fold-containing protein [Lactarius deliciosus]|nr:histone-fold-containing protein [Lactarius deliciosus]
MPRRENANTPASAQAQQDAVSEGIENFELPRALVTRIAKSAVPDNVKLQKDTVLSLVKGATVFINYLAATAHEVSTSKQHKSISASDVFKALEIIEFADLIPPLQAELQVYRELSKNKKGSAAGGASGSAPPARSKNSGAAAQRGKGKERTTDSADSHVSAPLPGALGALSLDPQPRVQVHEPSAPPDADTETHAMAEPEPDVGEGEGEGEDVGVDEEEDEDQTEPEAGLDEAEEDEAEDVDEAEEDVDVDVDVDVDMDTNVLEDGDGKADGEME